MTTAYQGKLMFLFAAAVVAPVAQAQSYPTKPVRIVTGSAGTSGDLLSRYLSQRLSEKWGKPVIVENRTGGGIVAAELVKHATPDGHTLHMAQQSSFAAAPSLYAKIAYDPIRDFAPLTLVAHVPQLLIAHAALPVTNLKELVAYAKARPGAVNFSSGGPTTAGNLTFELLNTTAGTKFVHVPYKGVSLATTAVMAGEVQVTLTPVPVGMPQVRAGKVKALAITSRNRYSGAPDVPTVAESGYPGFEGTIWFGMVAPVKIAPALAARLHTDIAEIVRAPAAKEWMLRQGAEPAASTPAEFTAFMQQEIVKWGKVIRAAGIRAE
ncbi:MAG TPA: tripartite tricarboxylate transporter substrate binding protein [Burkholderiales bacterium]|nr:tripartite tricarboxylate transporter substrate binding protein [Burkholderiales bacterium]